jgi:hypothetical protein
MPAYSPRWTHQSRAVRAVRGTAWWGAAKRWRWGRRRSLGAAMQEGRRGHPAGMHPVFLSLAEFRKLAEFGGLGLGKGPEFPGRRPGRGMLAEFRPFGGVAAGRLCPCFVPLGALPTISPRDVPIFACFVWGLAAAGRLTPPPPSIPAPPCCPGPHAVRAASPPPGLPGLSPLHV